MKKIDFRIILIIVLVIALILLSYFYFKEDETTDYSNYSNFSYNTNTKTNTNTDEEKDTYSIQTSAEVKSALSENIELHATYYLKEVYVEENQFVKKGENILKYTNGKYLTAPYDCVITSINVPNEGEKITNSHYIGIAANNILKVQVKVSESKINSIELGDDAKIKLTALSDKEYEGIVTNISNIASNGRFTVTIEFENDGNAYIGMTANVSL